MKAAYWESLGGVTVCAGRRFEGVFALACVGVSGALRMTSMSLRPFLGCVERMISPSFVSYRKISANDGAGVRRIRAARIICWNEGMAGLLEMPVRQPDWGWIAWFCGARKSWRKRRVCAERIAARAGVCAERIAARLKVKGKMVFKG